MSETTQTPAPDTDSVAKSLAIPEVSPSEKFVQLIEREFAGALNKGFAFNGLHRILARNMFASLDAALVAAEARRKSNEKLANKPPIVWANIDMLKLAQQAYSRVRWELDASIPNHLSFVPYLDSKTNKYLVDIRVGYVGRETVCSKFAISPIVKISHTLVCEGDEFEIYHEGDVEKFRHKRASVFEPGPAIGGFSYVQFEDSRKNFVNIVTKQDFEKAKKASGAVEFWGGLQKVWVNNKRVDGEFDEKFEREMQLKTVVHRTCAKIRLDPERINQAELSESLSLSPEAQLALANDTVEAEAAEFAGAEVITIENSETEPESTEAQTPAGQEEAPY